MKLTIAHTRYQGNTLIVTLLTALIIGIALGSYLTLVSHQNRSIMRSGAWNTCIPVLEAGIEEALTQVHYNGITNLSANGWFLGTDGCFHKSRSLCDGSYCEVTIQPVDPPVIVSTGYVLVPLPPPSQLGMIFAQIVEGPTSLSTRYLRRKVRVDTAKAHISGAGVTAKGRITFQGGGSLDSFDSSDPNYSTDGKYDPAKRKDGAAATTNAKGSSAILVETSHIYGSAITGPGGDISVGGGAIGDLAWNASNSGIQDGHSANDANVEFFDVPVPFTSGYFTPGGGILGEITATYLIGDGNYKMGSANIGDGGSIVVSGNAVLYVDGDFTTRGTGFVYLAPGASLKLYVSGRFDVSGTGIVNGTERAEKFSVFGLNTCTAFDYSAVSPFVGTVYAPYADLRFSGAAGASGSFVANTITISGGTSVHYDEHLNVEGPWYWYVAAGWSEI